MNKYGIHHITEAPYAYAKDFDTLTLRVRTVRGDIKQCIVYSKDKYLEDCPFEEKVMELSARTELFDYFTVDISNLRNRYMYYFKLIDNEGNEAFFNERGIKEGGNDGYAFIFPYIAYEDVYEEVKWIQESTVYQIFPERFCNGDRSIDPEGVLPWGEGKLTHYSMYGGDLRGIIDKLDYLKDLGIDVVYLTPIFKSNSTHKYNTCDYFNIDPQFGTVETAKELVEKCHERGMKIILDAVFNHSGNDFFAFKDLLKNQESSEYKDWYFVDSYPVSIEKGNYYTFGRKFPKMPKLNTNNNGVREYLLGVGEYWIKEIGIDGWRLDVCDEVGHDFWRAFKKRIKSVNKDAVIIGEIMHESNSFLKGDQLDSIMNYPFKTGVTDFFARKNITVEEFSNILGVNRMLYMDSIVKQMWNLIDSHDTKRFLTECNDDIDSMKLAVGFQFTYVGIPYIYYGDEIGMDGGDDPHNRKCMVWDKKKQNLDMLDYFKKLIKIRKENKTLIYGDYKELYCKDNVLIFERDDKEEKIIVAINNNNEDKDVEISFEGNGMELITEKNIQIKSTMALEGMEIKIIKLKH